MSSKWESGISDTFPCCLQNEFASRVTAVLNLQL